MHLRKHPDWLNRGLLAWPLKAPPLSGLLLWASASDWWHTFESFHLKCVRSNSRWTKLCAHVCWKLGTPPLQCDQNQIYFLGNKCLTHWVIHWLLGWFVTLKKWASLLELQLVIKTFISHFYLGMQNINEFINQYLIDLIDRLMIYLLVASFLESLSWSWLLMGHISNILGACLKVV